MLAVSPFPPTWMPLVATVLSLLTVAAIAAWIGSDRLSAVIPNANLRVAVAGAMLLVPASFEVFGTISHLQWIFGAFLIAYSAATIGSRWEAVLLFASAITGPVVFFTLPLYVLAAWFDPRKVSHLVIVLVAAALQGCVILTTGTAYPHPTVHFGDAAKAVIEHITQLPWYLGAIPFALVVLIAAPRPLTALLAGVGLGIAGAGIVRLGVSSPSLDTRYYWLASWLLISIIICGRRGILRTAAVAFVAGLIIANFRMPPGPKANTAGIALCIASALPCSVPIVVGVDDPAWTLIWPGR